MTGLTAAVQYNPSLCRGRSRGAQPAVTGAEKGGNANARGEVWEKLMVVYATSSRST